MIWDSYSPSLYDFAKEGYLVFMWYLLGKPRDKFLYLIFFFFLILLKAFGQKQKGFV